jgi:hypothetical protein
MLKVKKMNSIITRLLRSLLYTGLLLCLVILVGCGNSQTSVVKGSPTATHPPLATTPGTYAFVRDGDLWTRFNQGYAHPLTTFHLANLAAWGPITWSPDHVSLAFVLRGLPLAPGLAAGNPSQQTGTLFFANAMTGFVTSLSSGNATVMIPMLGQHVAWLDNQTALYTQNGNVFEVKLGSGNNLTKSATITQITGPKNVWEIAVRGTTLFYSTAANLKVDGTGTGEVHKVDISNASGGDHVVAVLGPVTLPAALGCGLTCTSDPTTPYVPYAWAVSTDGTQLAIQSVGQGVTKTSSPSPTATVASTSTVTAISSSNMFLLAKSDGSEQGQIFSSVPAPSAPVNLSFAPSGKSLALSLQSPAGSSAAYGPYIQDLAPKGGVTNVHIPQGTNQIAGELPTWTSDGQYFVMAGVPPIASRGDVSPTPSHGNGISTIYQSDLQGQVKVLETNADDPSWAGK